MYKDLLKKYSLDFNKSNDELLKDFEKWKSDNKYNIWGDENETEKNKQKEANTQLWDSYQKIKQSNPKEYERLDKLLDIERWNPNKVEEPKKQIINIDPHELEELIYKFYEYEYKISQLKLKNEEHPNIYKYENQLANICDELKIRIEEYLLSTIEINSQDNGGLEVLREIQKNNNLSQIQRDILYEEYDVWSLHTDAYDIYYNLLWHSKTLKDKIIWINQGINYVHGTGNISDSYEINEQLLDDLSSGKYVPEWDKQLSKIALMKNKLAQDLNKKYANDLLFGKNPEQPAIPENNKSLVVETKLKEIQALCQKPKNVKDKYGFASEYDEGIVDGYNEALEDILSIINK